MAFSFIVYGLIDPRDGELRYIGATGYDLVYRLNRHCGQESLGNTHKCNWIRELLRETGRIPCTMILHEDRSREDMYESEKRLIALFRSFGFNLTNTADGGQGASLRGERNGMFGVHTFSGVNHPMFGKHHSPETLVRMSTAKLGEKNAMYGDHRFSGEKNPNYGKSASVETRAKMSAVRIGRKPSKETITKLSAVRTGTHRSSETRERMRLSAIAAHARRRQLGSIAA